MTLFCEICGTKIVGRGEYIAIERSKLLVCKVCVRYGTVVLAKTQTPQPEAKVERILSLSRSGEEARLAKLDKLDKSKKRLYEQMDYEIEEGMEIVENYGRLIKEAREKAGLTQAELAQKINEKHSLLRKIEHEEILPTDDVRRKIMRILKISL